MNPLVLISEVTNGSAILPKLQRLGWGRLFSQKPITPLMYEKWGLDNQAFTAWNAAGQPFGLTLDDWCILWDADAYRKRLEEAKLACCEPYICVAPDIPASGYSLEWTIDWMSELPRDWPWYLALQDGMLYRDVEKVLHLFSGLFLGGSDAFKRQAYSWCQFAHRNEKKFHYARAGTPTKLKHAMKIGADSLDSSYPLWTKQRFSDFAHLWTHGDKQSEINF